MNFLFTIFSILTKAACSSYFNTHKYLERYYHTHFTNEKREPLGSCYFSKFTPLKELILKSQSYANNAFAPFNFSCYLPYIRKQWLTPSLTSSEELMCQGFPHHPHPPLGTPPKTHRTRLWVSHQPCPLGSQGRPGSEMWSWIHQLSLSPLGV